MLTYFLLILWILTIASCIYYVLRSYYHYDRIRPLIVIAALVLSAAITCLFVVTLDPGTSPATTAESVQMTPGQIIAALQRGEKVMLRDVAPFLDFRSRAVIREAAFDLRMSDDQIVAFLKGGDSTATTTLYIQLGPKPRPEQQPPYHQGPSHNTPG